MEPHDHTHEDENQPQQFLDPSHYVEPLAHYVKDFSFENPNAPKSLTQQHQPKVDVSVDVNVNPMENNCFEVSLRIQAKAHTEEHDIYVVDLTFGGMFLSKDLPAEIAEPIMLVYCPNLIFPYARRIVSDATRDGGFLPLMIQPIDFSSLYHQRLQGAAAASANEGGTTMN